jgi:hypothetical protein
MARAWNPMKITVFWVARVAIRSGEGGICSFPVAERRRAAALQDASRFRVGQGLVGGEAWQSFPRGGRDYGTKRTNGTHGTHAEDAELLFPGHFAKLDWQG